MVSSVVHDEESYRGDDEACEQELNRAPPPAHQRHRPVAVYCVLAHLLPPNVVGSSLPSVV